MLKNIIEHVKKLCWGVPGVVFCNSVLRVRTNYPRAVMPFPLERLNCHSLIGWLEFCAFVFLPPNGQLGQSYVYTCPACSLPFPHHHNTYCNIFRKNLLSADPPCHRLLLSQILLMEAPDYAPMVIARVLHGISSFVAWIIALMRRPFPVRVPFLISFPDAIPHHSKTSVVGPFFIIPGDLYQRSFPSVNWIPNDRSFVWVNPTFAYHHST